MKGRGARLQRTHRARSVRRRRATPRTTRRRVSVNSEHTLRCENFFSVLQDARCDNREILFRGIEVLPPGVIDPFDAIALTGLGPVYVEVMSTSDLRRSGFRDGKYIICVPVEVWQPGSTVRRNFFRLLSAMYEKVREDWKSRYDVGA